MKDQRAKGAQGQEVLAQKPCGLLNEVDPETLCTSAVAFLISSHLLLLLNCVPFIFTQ